MNNKSLFNYARLADNINCVCALTASAVTHETVRQSVQAISFAMRLPSGLVFSDWLVLAQTMSLDLVISLLFL